MNNVSPPKIMSWERTLDQHYCCNYDILITSGCSFTASTGWLDGPASWPGYVKDRCNIPLCVDLSYPGAGNEYIANSVLAEIESRHPDSYSSILVLIGWSGLDRKEDLVVGVDTLPKIDDISYLRAGAIVNPLPDKWQLAEVWRSWKNIIFTKNYLENKKIFYGFFSYCNLLDPPFLPKRDLTPEWPENIRKDRIERLQEINWIVPHNQSLFEFAFEHDCLDHDLFHPTVEGNMQWTDQILLPNLAKHQLISTNYPVDQ